MANDPHNSGHRWISPMTWSRRRVLWTVRLLLAPIHLAVLVHLGWNPSGRLVIFIYAVTCLGLTTAYDLGKGTRAR